MERYAYASCVGDPLTLDPIRVRFHRYPLKINITYPDGGKFVSYKVEIEFTCLFTTKTGIPFIF